MLPSKGLIKVIKFKAVIRFGSIYIMAHSRWRYDKNVMMVSAPPGRLTEPGSVGLTQTGVCALKQGTGIRFSNWKCFINTPSPTLLPIMLTVKWQEKFPIEKDHHTAILSEAEVRESLFPEGRQSEEGSGSQ